MTAIAIPYMILYTLLFFYIIRVGIKISIIIFEDAWNCRFLLHRRRGTETTK